MRPVPALLACLVATAARAADPAAPPVPVALPAWSDLFRSSAFSVVSENDKYFAGSDRHYTNGLKLSFLGETRVDESPAVVRQIAAWVPTLHGPLAQEQHYKVGVAIGQNIYTPTDIHTDVAQPDDRPYAAWLYASLVFQAQSDDADARLLRIVEISLGLVGPSALGRQIQNGFHDIIGVAHAQGWSHQLHNEPGLDLAWERRYRVGRLRLPVARLQSDLILRGGLTLGNIHTYAAGGAEVRVGWRLPRDFGADLIRPAGGSMALDHRAAFYFFASGETRAVARDIFLDGNTWTDSPSVPKRPVVADLNLGLAGRIRVRGSRLKAIQVTYAENYRTKEFYGQAQRDVFGSIGTSFLF